MEVIMSSRSIGFIGGSRGRRERHLTACASKPADVPRIVGRADMQQPQRIIEFGSPEFMALARQLAQDNRQGTIMMRGEVMLVIDGERVLVRNN